MRSASARRFPVQLEQEFVVDAPQVHGEVEPTRYLGDGVVLRIGMGLADRVDDVRSGLLLPEACMLHEAGEFHERKHGVAAEPARNSTGVAVDTVYSAGIGSAGCRGYR